MSCRHAATYDTRALANAAAMDKKIKVGVQGGGDKGWEAEGCPHCHKFIVTTRRTRTERRQRANRRS